MVVLPIVDEEGWEITVNFYVFSVLLGGFYDDTVRGGADVLEVVLLVERVFILHLDVEVLCWLFCRVLRQHNLGYFVGRESREGDSVVGRMRIGDGVISVLWLTLVSDDGRCCGLQCLVGLWWCLLLRHRLSACRRRSSRRF